MTMVRDSTRLSWVHVIRLSTDTSKENPVFIWNWTRSTVWRTFLSTMRLNFPKTCQRIWKKLCKNKKWPPVFTACMSSLSYVSYLLQKYPCLATFGGVSCCLPWICPDWRSGPKPTTSLKLNPWYMTTAVDHGKMPPPHWRRKHQEKTKTFCQSSYHDPRLWSYITDLI